jgi:hypothetical protein
MNTYEVKQTIEGVDYLEMTTADGTISDVPMVTDNADYQAYLESLEA